MDKDINGLFYKFIPESYTKWDFTYKIGINIDTKPFIIDYDINERDLEPTGLYLTNVWYLYKYYDYGPILCEVKLCEDSIVVDFYKSECRANKFNIIRMFDLRSDSSDDLFQILKKCKEFNWICYFNNINLINKFINKLDYRCIIYILESKDINIKLIKYLYPSKVSILHEQAISTIVNIEYKKSKKLIKYILSINYDYIKEFKELAIWFKKYDVYKYLKHSKSLKLLNPVKS